MNRVLRLLAGATIGFTVAAVIFRAAHAGDFQTGNQLLSNCESSDIGERMLCMGYVEGIAGAMGQNAVNGYLACIPPTVNAGQARDVARAYLYANPTVRHFMATGLVAKAMQNAFPCASSAHPKLNS